MSPSAVIGLTLQRSTVLFLVRCLALILSVAPLALSQTSETSLPPDGKAIFLQRCAKCHGSDGGGVNAVLTIAGPSLKAVRNPGVVLEAMEVGPSHMPSFAFVLSVPEMRAVAGYVTQELAVMPLGGGDLTDGGKLFRIYCAACHQTAARGGAIAFAGVNAPDITVLSSAIVAGAIRWGPGPMPSFPDSVLNNKQVASIVDFVRFAQHAPKPGGTSLNWYGPTVEGLVAWILMFGLIVTTVWIEKGGKG